jgi:hypothetical protein
VFVGPSQGHGVVEGGWLLEFDVDAHLWWQPGGEDGYLLVLGNVVAAGE